MNLNSIITKIILVFIISITLFIAVFIAYFYYEKSQINSDIKNKYANISKYIKDNKLDLQEVIEYTKELNLQAVENPQLLFEKPNIIDAGPGFEIIKDNDIFYLHLHTPFFRILLKDLSIYKQNYLGFWILSFVFIIFVFSFMWIIKALSPLKQLKEKIELFSNGNLNIDCKSDKKDEIAQVSNEFNNAAKKISLLLESRQLFLRTIMHELKTPIAKGRIVAELIDDEKQKNRVTIIFEKLNYLVNDFAKIEELISGNYSINKYPSTVKNVVEKAIELMMLDKVEDKIQYENISKTKIEVDSTLISMAIKNLLDNALKYSSDKKVIIKEEDNKLLIISEGNKLEKPLEEYFKPFHNDTNSKNHGMGLGLYIVHSILQMHDLNLKYNFIDNKNIFTIHL
jgi:two-component system, OmpR family, sensor kinase